MMRVYISNYRHHWLSPYTILEKFFFWRKDYDAYEVEPPQWLQNICEWNMKLLDTIHPKIECVKIDGYDTYSMDYTLGLIALPMLRHIRELKQGSPCVDDEDVPDSLKSCYAPRCEDEWDTDDFFHERWGWVLDQMIMAFESQNNDWQDQYRSGESDLTFIDNAVGHGPNHTLVYDWDGMKEHGNRIQNGFRLFGKYYQNLWT